MGDTPKGTSPSRSTTMWCCHPQLRVRHQLTHTYLSLARKTFNFRPCGFWPHLSLLMSVFSKEGSLSQRRVAPEVTFGHLDGAIGPPWTATEDIPNRLCLPMAKVGSLDPRINDNHTYLPCAITRSLQGSCYQAHIRKVNQLIVLYSLNEPPSGGRWALGPPPFRNFSL